jgi:hypothetical protein
MAGVYSNNSPENLELKTKSRGFGLKVFTYDENGEEIQLTFDLDEYELTEQDGELGYLIRNMRPVTIAKSVIWNDYDPSLIGKMELIEKFIKINGDTKRRWFKDLKNLNQLNESCAQTFK